MKIKLYFEKENLIRLAVAVVFAAVLFAVIRFPVWVLFGFGVLYFGIKSLKIELNENVQTLDAAVYGHAWDRRHFYGVSYPVSVTGCGTESKNIRQ